MIMFGADVLCVVAIAGFREFEEVSISATLRERRPPNFPVVAATFPVWSITPIEYGSRSHHSSSDDDDKDEENGDEDERSRDVWRNPHQRWRQQRGVQQER